MTEKLREKKKGRRSKKERKKKKKERKGVNVMLLFKNFESAHPKV